MSTNLPPVLTVRAFAEMMELPAYQQIPILEDQKYPSRASASFRVPYYRPGLLAIRRFYQSGRQQQALDDAIADIESSRMLRSRIENNVRVIRAFRRSTQPRRELTLQSFGRLRFSFHGVMLRYTPDLYASGGQRHKHIVYNCRQAPITPEVARRTLELAYWILTTSEVNLARADLEYAELSMRRKTYTTRNTRSHTLKYAQQNARAIINLWRGDLSSQELPESAG